MVFPYHSICVFCGSAGGLDPVFCTAAYELGSLLADQGVTLVYGAGYTGMMGALAQGALDHHGEVIGITHELESRQISFLAGLSRVETMANLQQRKARLNELADAFIVLPGGLGTMDELFEVLTWAQIGLQQKPAAILNVNGYFDPLLTWFERAAQEQFMAPEHLRLFVVDEHPTGLLLKLAEFHFPEKMTSWFKKI